MKILIISKDATLFKRNGKYIGDARKRHIVYAQTLRQKYPHGEIKIITYSVRSDNLKFERVVPGLILYGTNSWHRAMYFIDLFLPLMKVFKNGWRPDLITVQTPWEEGVVGLVVSKIFNIAFLPQLHFNLFSDKWLRESFLNKWRRMVAKFIFNKATHIRVVSSQLAYRVSSNFSIPISKISIVPVGVIFKPKKSSKKLCKRKISKDLINKKVVLFVGRLCAQKNLRLFVETSKKILESLPETVFILVGGGEEKELILKWIGEFGIEDNFLVMGPQLHSKLPEIYAASDVFLLTSHYEGFGRVILEAQLSSIPVVSTNCVGPDDLIVDGVNGFIINEPIADELAAKMICLLSNDRLALAFGKNARASAIQRFSMDIITSNLLRVWEKSVSAAN
jgi:glycosyltransferase involved in cell wall biosynthesis